MSYIYTTLYFVFASDNLMKLEIYFKDLGVHESKKSPAYSAEGLVCEYKLSFSVLSTILNSRLIL